MDLFSNVINNGILLESGLYKHCPYRSYRKYKFRGQIFTFGLLEVKDEQSTI